MIPSREAVEILMSAISDAVLAVDASGKILFFNDRFKTLYDLPEQGQDIKQLLQIDAFQTFKKSMKENQNAICSLEFIPATDKNKRFFTLSVSPLHRTNAGREVYGAIGIFHDVTELKQAEKMRIDFVANVSHELRTPLTAIKGYNDTILSDAKSGRFDSVQQFCGVIARNTDRLMRLIEDLLELSSIESGVDQLSAEVNTREITERVIGQLENKWFEKSHKIETAFGAETVIADPCRLEQVLVNLIDNAIKYVPSGGLIKVLWEQNADKTVLRVQDNGPGIPLKYQHRIFQRFYRVDKARAREMGGTGLGLAIVKHIMQRHGGSVGIKSEVGEGTEFFCEFPLASS